MADAHVIVAHTHIALRNSPTTACTMFGNLFGGDKETEEGGRESGRRRHRSCATERATAHAFGRARAVEPTPATRDDGDDRDVADTQRERDAAAGTIIAVSANYTAYGIRGGLIRVIHRHSDAMGLLRGHSHNPQDLAFLAGTDVLASVAGDGNLFVWKLQRADSGEISPEEVFHATWEAKASGPPERLAFKPAAEPGLLVTVSHHGDDAAKLKLWDLRGSPALGPQDLDTGGSDTTRAVAFSGDGAKLATGDGRGGVAVGTLATAAAWAPSRSRRPTARR